MKHAKKSLSIIMSIVLLFSVASMFSTAYAYNESDDGNEYHQSGIWVYTLKNGEATITGINDSEDLSGTVNVPETLDGYPVTGIYWISTNNFGSIIDLYIPESVIKLTDPDWGEFGYGIKSITVDENNPAFSSEDGVLFNKAKTELLCYPQNKADTTYSVPENVKTIANHAFGGSKLTSITIPASVTSIDTSAFYYCDELKSITVDTNNQHYSADAYGVLFNKDKTTLIKAFDKSLTEYSIPNSVTTISDSAFLDFSNLAYITMPESLKTIGENAFNSCQKLAYINLPEGTETISPMAFAWSGIETLYIPASVTQIDYLTAGWSSSLAQVYFGGSLAQWNSALTEMNPDDYVYDADYALLEADICYNYVLEESSGTCGTNATWFYNGIDTLVISGSGAMAEYPQCENAPWNDIADKITKLEIKEGITEIDGFYNLENIETLILPESLKYIESCTFGWSVHSDFYEQNMYPETIIYKGMPEQWKAIKRGSHVDYDYCYCYNFYGIIYIDNEDFKIDTLDVIVDSTTVKYGETAYIYADIPMVETENTTSYFLPVGTHLSWYGEDDGYFNGYLNNGEEYCLAMTSENSGTTTITVRLEDEDGWTIYNDDDEPIEASIELTSKAGFFERLSYFFKNLFNLIFSWLMF